MSDERIICVPDEPFKYKGSSLGYAYFKSMLKHKNQIAQIDVNTGQKVSYHELFLRCVRTALQLKKRGIKRNHVILLNTNNHMNAYVPFIASQLLGVKIASLDPSIPLKDTKFLLNQVEPFIIFTIPEVEDLMMKAVIDMSSKPEIVVFGKSILNTNFEEFLTVQEGEEQFQPEEVNYKDTAVILFSSGSTGLPKGICCNHQLLLKAAHAFIEGSDVKNVLYYSTPYWISAIMCLTKTMISGTTRLLVDKFNGVDFWNILSKYEPTFLFAAPTQMVQIIKLRTDDSILEKCSLTHVLVGGGPVPMDYVTRLQKVLPNALIFQAYGQTEVGVITKFVVNNPVHLNLLMKYPKSCGVPISGCDVKITDPDTETTLSVDQVGEIRVRSPYVMNGYHGIDMTQLRDTLWDSDGFVRTGDLGYYNSDGCFYVVDRIKEMLKYQSWHITPAKIEAELLSHPAVWATVVIGKPHDEDGDHALALVVLKKGAVDVNEEDLKRYADERVDDRHRLRGGVLILNRLLCTPSGKYRRSEMRKLILNGIRSF